MLIVCVSVRIRACVVEEIVAINAILRTGVGSVVSSGAAVLRSVVLLASRVTADDSTVVVVNGEVGWAVGVDVDTTFWRSTASVGWNNADWQVESVDVGDVVVVLTTWDQGEFGQGDWGDTWLSAAESADARADLTRVYVLFAEVTVSSAPDATRVPVVWNSEGLSVAGIELESTLTTDSDGLWEVRRRPDTWEWRAEVSWLSGSLARFSSYLPGQIVYGQLFLTLIEAAFA